MLSPIVASRVTNINLPTGVSREQAIRTGRVRFSENADELGLFFLHQLRNRFRDPAAEITGYFAFVLLKV